MAVVIRSSVRIAAQDRALASIGARGKVPDRLRPFVERLQALLLVAMHDPTALALLCDGIAALARHDPAIARRLSQALPREAKRGTRPAPAWQDDEVRGLYDVFLRCEEALGKRHPEAAARRELAALLRTTPESIRKRLGRNSDK